MINTGLGTILFGIFFSLLCHVELCKLVEFIDPWNSYTTFNWPYYATVEDTQRIMFAINYLQTHFECDPSTYFCLNTLNFDVIYQDPNIYHRCFCYFPGSPTGAMFVTIESWTCPIEIPWCKRIKMFKMLQMVFKCIPWGRNLAKETFCKC